MIDNLNLPPVLSRVRKAMSAVLRTAGPTEPTPFVSAGESETSKLDPEPEYELLSPWVKTGRRPVRSTYNLMGDVRMNGKRVRSLRFVVPTHAEVRRVLLRKITVLDLYAQMADVPVALFQQLSGRDLRYALNVAAVVASEGGLTGADEPRLFDLLARITKADIARMQGQGAPKEVASVIPTTPTTDDPEGGK